MTMSTEPNRRRAGSSAFRSVLILVAIAFMGAAAFFLFRSMIWPPDGGPPSDDQNAPNTAVEGPTQDESNTDLAQAFPQTSPPVEAVVPTPLRPPKMIEDPNAFVEDWAERIPLVIPTTWLSIDAPLARLVGATNAIALGENPLKYLSFVQPSGAFEPAISEGGERVLPADLDERYRPFLDLLDSIDPELVAEAFRQAEPYLDRSYQKLGYPDGRFRPVLIEAIELLRDTPHPETPIVLIADSVNYKYADPELEELDIAQRLLLRLSPTRRQLVDRQLAAVEASLAKLPN